MDAIEAYLETVRSKDDLANLIDMLKHDLEHNSEEWENTSLASFLEAMSAWIRDMDGYYQHIGETTPTTPSWKTIGDIIIAASRYE